MASKIEHVNRAFYEIRISGLTVEPTPRHLESGMIVLEDMMAELEDNSGLCLNYNFEDTPNANTESGVLRSANNMIGTNLAVRLIASFNKIAPPSLMALASGSLSKVSTKVASDNIRAVQAPQRMPLGSGHRYFNRYQRFVRPVDLPLNVCATVKTVVGDIDDYQESFHAYLLEELIASYVLEPTDGIEILSSSVGGDHVDIVQYRAKTIRSSKARHSVKITITTDTGRIETRIREFEINQNQEDEAAAGQTVVSGSNLIGLTQPGTNNLGG